MSEEDEEYVSREVNLLDRDSFDAAIDELLEENGSGEIIGELYERREEAMKKAGLLEPSYPEETPARRELPANPGQARDEDLVAWAKGETGPEKISFERAKALGGPDNPRVAEMMRRGLVEGITVRPTPAESIQADGGVSMRPLITEGAKARFEEAKRVYAEQAAAKKKAQAELEERQKDPQGYKRRKTMEHFTKLPPEERSAIIADAKQRDFERVWGKL